jgi:hypothetical protein
MKIDIFNHIFPKKFFDKYIDAGQGGKDIGKRVSNIQTIVDVDSRFRILDEFGDYVQGDHTAAAALGNPGWTGSIAGARKRR